MLPPSPKVVSNTSSGRKFARLPAGGSRIRTFGPTCRDALDLSGANLKIAWPEFGGSRSLIKLETRATTAPSTSLMRARPNAKAKERSPPAAGFSFAGPGAGSRSAAPAALALPVDFAEAILQPLAFLAVGRVGEPVLDLVLGAFESLAMLAERLLFAPALVWSVTRRRIT